MYVFLTWFDSYEQQSIYFALFFFLFKKDFSLLNVFFSLSTIHMFFFKKRKDFVRARARGLVEMV